MSELKAQFDGLGFKNATTYIQSGNVVFASPREDVPDLAQKISNMIQTHFGFNVPIIVINQSVLEKILQNNPYLENKDVDTKHLAVCFLDKTASRIKIEEIEAIPMLDDTFVIRNKSIYLHCPFGFGRSKLTNSFFEQKLGVTATSRNWKTVNTLFEMSKKLLV